ncbi:hypothetical protein BD309DRAFT_664010 [Dichomitus squalens]|nr:hypothetical protein BD309DRAFT_664010 [Dichomitus squalens]
MVLALDIFSTIGHSTVKQCRDREGPQIQPPPGWRRSRESLHGKIPGRAKGECTTDDLHCDRRRFVQGSSRIPPASHHGRECRASGGACCQPPETQRASDGRGGYRRVRWAMTMSWCKCA